MSRAAYKLLEIQKKHKVIKKGALFICACARINSNSERRSHDALN